jgi:hypothetical protein
MLQRDKQEFNNKKYPPFSRDRFTFLVDITM